MQTQRFVFGDSFLETREKKEKEERDNGKRKRGTEIQMGKAITPNSCLVGGVEWGGQQGVKNKERVRSSPQHTTNFVNTVKIKQTTLLETREDRTWVHNSYHLAPAVRHTWLDIQG